MTKPAYDSSKRSPRKYTDKMDKRIDELLAFDSEKTRKLGPHKQKLTARSSHQASISIRISGRI